MKFGLKSNMLLGFVSAAIAIIFAIGMVVTWQLNKSTGESAALITDVVRANANERVRRHVKIFENYLVRIEEKIETQAIIINSQSGVAQFLENDHLPPLKKHLSSATELGQLSFGIFFDLEGNQSVSFPENETEISLDGQFGILRSGGSLRAQLAADDAATGDALSSVMRLDGEFLQNFGLSEVIAEGEGALAAVSAITIRDDFGETVGFLVLGKLLNDYNVLPEQLSAITDSAFVIYVDGQAISSAGFAAMVPAMDRDAEAAVAESTDGQVVALDADGEKYIAFCAPLGLESGVNGAYLCAGVPEAGVVVAQNDMVSYGAATSKAVQLSILIVGIIALVIFVALSFIMANRIAGPLVKMAGVTGQLAGGDMEVEVPGGNRNDEIGEMARSLEHIRTVGVMAARAQSSLDDASSPMMIVDPDGTVIFPNKAMTALAEELAGDLGGELRGFADGVLTGNAFDTLHNVEPMQAGRLMTLDEPASARMVAGGRTIDLTASPVFNEAGDRLGAVVEWADITGQVAVEHEIAGIVRAAGEGNFTSRLDEDGKDGFMLDLAQGMNELVGTVDRGLSETVKVVSALAEGDLTQRMEGDYEGAFAQLKQDANSMADQIESIAGRISSVTGAVRGATREIASGITDLSARTEHQASSLEETTASMEELSTTVRQNADNAQEANQASVAAREAAVTGGEVAEKAVAAMSGIEDSSRQITDIVGLIQEIAFQTNLLALNASVEAARAGDAGRGFAVVANEVRALAQRAATASKDIKTLIVNSDTQVKGGVELVNQAGASLGEIVASVKKVADFVSDIAAASQEQSAGIDQVSNAITNMDEMTQQNASLVEETTAALNSAQTQIEDLRQAVGFFKTAQAMQAEPREADAGDLPAANPVAEQQRSLARKVAASGRVATAAAVEVDEEWQEF